jgi:hypothetical protein
VYSRIADSVPNTHHCDERDGAGRCVRDGDKVDEEIEAAHNEREKGRLQAELLDPILACDRSDRAVFSSSSTSMTVLRLHRIAGTQLTSGAFSSE